MLKLVTRLSLCAAAIAAVAFGQEGQVPKGVPPLDHIFVIMMENHAYSQIIGNPDAPFLNSYAKEANLATNYYAVGHPSLTNYLEVVGGSNFCVRDDNSPDWHNSSCQTNLSTGIPNLESTSTAICPIEGHGKDGVTPAIDTTNETPGKPTIDLDGKASVPQLTHIWGITIADQLWSRGMTWKSYQEDLPPSGADKVNVADGYFSNLSNLATALPGENQTQSNLIGLYAVKHNPFAYFARIQEGAAEGLSLKRTVPFSGPNGLFADLASGDVPTYSFIAPNQCNDMHGRGNAGPNCEYDPNDNGTLTGLNPALIRAGDDTVRNLVIAIHQSPVWHLSRSAIVVLWDENDYSIAPTTNKIPVIVETNYGVRGVKSNSWYDHFSLLRTIEGAFGLPCLNHACDNGVSTMTPLFQ